ncbi:MAG: LysR family transcriptional regulator [Nakamurella sp.]
MLSARMPDLDALQVLLAVAHTGSLNAAARQVGVSQQAVSARIAAIEAQVGVPLVTRTPQGSTLTPAGVTVTAWADRLVRMAAEFDAGLAALRQDRRAHLPVSASLTIAEQLLPRWLVAFHAATRSHGQPATEVTLTATNSDQVLTGIRDEKSDLGFIEGPSVPRGIRSRVVGHDHLVVVARPDHPWVRRGRAITAATLNHTPLVSREEGSGTRDALLTTLRQALGPVEPAPAVMALSTTSAVRAAVLAGAGPAVLSALALTDDLATGRLRAVAVADLDLSRTLRAVWLGPPQPPAGPARDLLSHILAHHQGG